MPDIRVNNAEEYEALLSGPFLQYTWISDKPAWSSSQGCVGVGFRYLSRLLGNISSDGPIGIRANDDKTLGLVPPDVDQTPATAVLCRLTRDESQLPADTYVNNQGALYRLTPVSVSGLVVLVDARDRREIVPRSSVGPGGAYRKRLTDFSPSIEALNRPGVYLPESAFDDHGRALLVGLLSAIDITPGVSHEEVSLRLFVDLVDYIGRGEWRPPVGFNDLGVRGELRSPSPDVLCTLGANVLNALWTWSSTNSGQSYWSRLHGSLQGAAMSKRFAPSIMVERNPPTRGTSNGGN